MDDILNFSFSSQASLVWEINHLFQSSEERASQCFTFQGVKCHMILELNVSKSAYEDEFTVDIEIDAQHSSELNAIGIKSYIKDLYGRKCFSISKFLNSSSLESRVNVWYVSRKTLLANYGALINQPDETLTFCCEFKPLIEYKALTLGPNKDLEEKYLSDEEEQSTSEEGSNKEISTQPSSSEDMTMNKMQKSVSNRETRRTRNENSELTERRRESFGTGGAASGLKPLNHIKRLSLDLGALLANGKGADVTLNCTDRKFPVHRSILRSRCKMFADKCFKGNEGDIIEVTDVDSLVLEKFLECVYTGKVSKLTESTAEELYILGNKYKFEPVILPCAEFLVKKLNDENVNKIFKLVSLYDDNKSLKGIVRFIIDNGKIDETWFKTTFESPDVLLEVYKAIDLHGKYY